MSKKDRPCARQYHKNEHTYASIFQEILLIGYAFTICNKSYVKMKIKIIKINEEILK